MPGGATYLHLRDDYEISSKAGGALQRVILTPREQWNAAMGATTFLGALHIGSLDPNCGIAVKVEFSFDGVNWLPGQVIIAEKIAAGYYAGEHTITVEQFPWRRVVAEIRDTTAAAQVYAVVSAWQYMVFHG